MYKFVNLPYNNAKKSNHIKVETSEHIKPKPDVTRDHDDKSSAPPRHRIERRASVIKMSGKVSPTREPSPKPEEDRQPNKPIKEEHVDVERVSPQSFASSRSYPLPERVMAAPVVVPMNLNAVAHNSVSTKMYNYHQVPYMNPYTRALPYDIFPYHPYTLMQSPCCGRMNVAALQPRSVIIRPANEHYGVTTHTPPPLIKAEADDVVRERYEAEEGTS